MVTIVKCDTHCIHNADGNDLCDLKELNLKQNIKNCDYGDYPEHLHCHDYNEHEEGCEVCMSESDDI